MNKIVNTYAGGGGSPEQVISRGFTMAEILLSLTIIGVVAAITLPSLTGNINERTWNTQRKALYARFSQAISLMPAMNGYGILTAAVEANEETGVSAKDAVDTAAEAFVTEGLSKVLKINNICDSEHLADCGIPQKITALDANQAFSSQPKTLYEFNPKFESAPFTGGDGSYRAYTQLNTKAAALETANGESILVYYNPYCKSESDPQSLTYVQPWMCANFVYDLNGTKGPNTVGKDIGFITVLYSSDPVVVAPMPLNKTAGSAKQIEAGGKCKNVDAESRLPNKEEAAALFINRDLLKPNGYVGAYWTSSAANNKENYWYQNMDAGVRYPIQKNAPESVLCIKR